MLLLAGTSANAAEMSQPPTKTTFEPGRDERPKIGLVLSGGGARGAAHVGVLKVLHELKIPVDVVVGTSMGAVVGGLYASGMGPDQIEQALLAQDWGSMFKDLPDRPLRPFRRKHDDRLYLVKFKPGFNEGEFELPVAAIQGQYFDLTLNRLTLGVAKVSNFDQLSIPYRAVATDIVTGEPVVLDRGSLARAMRASLAVPGAFAPVEIDGRLLVDGGVSNNLPMDVAREMGADVLIVVNISTSLSERERLQSVLGIVNQLTTLLVYRGTAEQMETLRPQDILITPDLGDITSSAFDRAGESIPIGATAARDQADRLRALSVPPMEYAQFQELRKSKVTPPPIIDLIRIDNQSHLDDAMIAVRFHQQVGHPLDVAQLEHDVSELYALEVFESVRYDLVEDGARTGLVLHAVEKSWGPNFVQFGLSLSSNLEGDSDFNAAVAYTRTQLNRLNGEARIALQVGERPAAVLDGYQPLDPASRYFIFGTFGVRQRPITAFDAGEVVSEYRVREVAGEAGGGTNLGDWGEFRLGFRRGDGRADVRLSERRAEDFDFARGELRPRITLDTLDNVEFPRRGRYAELEWIASRTSLGADNEFDQVLFSFTQPHSWGRHTLLGTTFYQTTLEDDAPIQNTFTAGGFLRLSGLQEDELAGQHFALVRTMYYRQVRDTIYLGFSAELGNVWQDSSDISLEDSLWAGSAFLGADTPIGPFYFGLGNAEGGRHGAYLFLGLPY